MYADALFLPVINRMTTRSMEDTSGFAKAVFFILLAILLFDLQGVIIKHMGDRYPVQQLATFRNIFGLIPSLLVLLCSQQWHDNGRKLAITQWRLGLLRGLYVTGAQLCFYLSLTKMEFATATTLAFIGPVFVTILSVPLLKHTVGLWRWSAVAIGFVGLLLIMRPGTEIFSLYAILPICASFGYALSTVSVRLIDDAVPTATINLYASVGALVGTTAVLFATTGYVPTESAADWILLVTMGTVGGFAVLSMITAYRLTKPSNLSPFEYFGIPFSFTLGWVFFSEAPFGKLFPGVIFVIAGGLLIAWRERKNRPSVTKRLEE